MLSTFELEMLITKNCAYIFSYLKRLKQLEQLIKKLIYEVLHF